MNNVTTFDNFPPFATNGSRNMNTESAKYAVGFLEGETFPAEWANYLFHGATKGVSDLNTAVQSIWKENINVIQGSGQTPSSSDNTQLKTAIELMIQNAVLTANSQVLAQAKLDAHPVGSLYWSSDPTDPSELFGGTWTRIKDRFVLAAGDTYDNGSTGGSATVKLTESNLPAHSHGGSTGRTQPSFQGKESTGSFAAYGTEKKFCWADGVFSLSSSYVDYGADHSRAPGAVFNFSMIPKGYVGIHSHTIPSCGANEPHENMPPFITKYCWERTA